MSYSIITGDCRTTMADMEPDSVDAIVTDPPYGLGFMGKDWDVAVPGPEFWTAALRVAKPGAHLLAFGGTRLWHRLAVAVEEAGWEIRDTVMWLHGQGFPKSLDVSKAIDTLAGATRTKTPTVGMLCGSDVGAISPNRRCAICDKPRQSADPCRCPRDTGPATPDAARWSGWGTALKPAWEPVIVARKPLIGTVAANVLAHGTGGINVDGCRIGTSEDTRRNAAGGDNGMVGSATFKIRERRAADVVQPSGRWPANLILDESAAAALDEQSGHLHGAGSKQPPQERWQSTTGFVRGTGATGARFGDSGGASRFFYVAKPSRAERNNGGPNRHPTVKPIALMRHLVRLVTPPGGLVLDPFTGSGTTGCAARLEGFRFVGCEMDPEHAELARSRIAAVEPEPVAAEPEQADLFEGVA